jgi:hypothetical protein
MPKQLELDLEDMLDTHPRQLTEAERAILRPQLREFLQLLNELNISLKSLEFLSEEPPGRHDSLQ